MNLTSKRFYRYPKKSLHDIKIIFSLILGITFTFNSFASNNVYSQTEITINVENASIINVLDEVEAITKLRFIFDSSIYNFNEKVTLSLENMNIDEFIIVLFNNKIDYQISENLIFLKQIVSNPVKKQSEDLIGNIQRSINGVVVDSDGVPLPGATIIEQGTDNGTTTDFNGNFSIVLENDETMLTISFLGYGDQSIDVSNVNSINVSLSPKEGSLEEIIVTGYGTTRKKDLVSSIAKISGDALSNQPASNVSNLLQGRAAGLQVTAPDGDPSSAPTIRIRGLSSIQGNNNPLFVIDGFIAGTDFNLQNINVNDIRSIEVLKDASSLALYGTRGAAGVILIQTKNGKSAKSGDLDVSINHYTSFSSIANQPEYLNSNDFANYWNEAETLVYGDSGYGENDQSIDPLFDLSTIPNTNWVDLVTRNGQVNNTDITLSGNSEKSNYYVSLNRWSEQAIIESSGLDRYTLRANMDFDVNEKIRSGLRLNLSDRKIENNKVNWQQIQNSMPPFLEVYNSDGTYNGVNPVANTPFRNPLADVNERIDHTQTSNLLTNAYLEYDVIPGLTFRSTIGLALDFSKRNQYLSTILPNRVATGQDGEAAIISRNSRDILNENTVTYDKDFNEHSLKVLAGYTTQTTTFESSRSGAYGFVNDVVTFNNLALGSDPNQNSVSSNYEKRTFESILGRINYSYKDKYLLTLVGRRDGSSVFEEGNKYAFFPSLGAAWRIGQESFMQSIDYISNLKLRVSHGIVGEQGVPAYNSLSRYTPYVNFLNNEVSNAVILENLASSNLNWETTTQTDIGIEVGFLNNRYSLELDYYNKRTKDLLLNRPIPGTAGETRLENVGEIENKGFELSVNSLNIDKPDFTWSTNLTISANKNKVLSIGDGQEFINLDNPNGSSGPSIRIMPGYPAPAFLGATYLGTYKTPAEIDSDGIVGSVIGGPRYIDLDGNGAINQLDFIVHGDPNPEFYGGLRNTITYKQFTLDFFFHGSYGNEILNGAYHLGYFGRDPRSNLLPIVKDRWTTSNQNSDIPRAGSSFGNYQQRSDVSYQDGSFLRLKNVTLTYDLDIPRIKRASIYLTGNNLLLLTKFKHGDPEQSNYGDGLAQGVANGGYPYNSSFALGFNLTL